MPRIVSKKTKQYRIIKDLIEKDYSANKIQIELRLYGIGVRRKKLLAEIRSIKGKQITKEKREKHIPKKYRKEKPKRRKLKFGEIYRGSLIISSVPLHSRPFNRRYIGFRLNIFSFDKNEVYSGLRSLKRMFIKKVGDYLSSYQYASEQIMGTEKPIKIIVSNPEKLNGTWNYAVEEKGKGEYSESGEI